MAGEEVSGESVNTVKDVPKQFKEWLDENKDWAQRSYSVPYFLSDNKKYLPKDYLKMWGLKTPYASYAEYEQAMKYNKTHASFTDEQRRNNRELSDALPVIQGKIMNFTEADAGRSNPNFTLPDARDKGYTENCQTCTVSYELRRRGFNVEALPNKGWEINEYYKNKGINISDRFLNSDGSKARYTWSGYSVQDTITAKLDFIENASKETGRYEVICTWKNERFSHVFVVERQRNGNLLWCDPQSGRHGGAFKDYLKRMRRFEIGVMRIDDKIINPKFAERFKRGS